MTPLNEEKTEYILFGEVVTSDFGALTSKLRPTVKNLGLIFYCSLKFDKQIDSVVKAFFFSFTSFG